MKIKIILSVIALLALISACGPAPDTAEQTCSGNACTEADINAPIDGSEEAPVVLNPAVEFLKAYSLPAYRASWGLPRRIYDKAARHYSSRASKLTNTRYLTIIDMSQHSSRKRLYLFDLAAGKVERHNTSHGVNSDPNNDGIATSFSNVPNSRKTSLGLYQTLGTYTGKNGHSMRLRGLESTNSNAERRAIVVHPARYISNSGNRAGRSWGCPALDSKVSRSVIDRIKGGSLLLIDR